MAVLSLVGGLVVLVGGAELLVRGASRLAIGCGISPLVVGLTVVAFGTSAPEFAVSLSSVLTGRGDVGVGNVIGSNVFNVLFVLGVSAVIVPMAVSSSLVRFDVPLMLGSSILVWILALDGRIGRVDGLVLFACLVGYLVRSIVVGRRGGTTAIDEVAADAPSPPMAWAAILGQVAMLMGGLGLLVVGSGWLVDGASTIASGFGVSDLLIGLTIVAAGTSLPEAATSIVAAARGQREIAVGNVVGSNLFNLFGVLGLTAAVAEAGVTVPAPVLRLDLPVMVVAAVACLPIFFTGMTIDRGEGVLLLLYYASYLTALFMAAGGGDPTWLLWTATGSLVVGLAVLWFAMRRR